MTAAPNRFVWTESGHKVHVSADDGRTRCGWPTSGEVTPDEVAWFWPPCSSCLPLGGAS